MTVVIEAQLKKRHGSIDDRRPLTIIGIGRLMSQLTQYYYYYWRGDDDNAIDIGIQWYC